MKYFKHATILQIVIILPQISHTQRTSLDDMLSATFRSMRSSSWIDIIGRTGDRTDFFEMNRRNGKLQKQFSNSMKFFCDTVKEPRSKTVPTSVHKLRPGDIDIIAGMGDSLTAGNGAMAVTPLQITIENKGISWSIGGQANWRKFLTIPNILKEFNPKLYGYSLKDGTSVDRSSRFNVAELGAMSRDMPYQAKILIQRMKSDPLVNLTQHWKILTVFIGSNDFCSDICYHQNPKNVVDWHERDLVQTLRTLRDNIPRLMVQLLVTPTLKLLTNLKGTPAECEMSLRFECPCLIGRRSLDRSQQNLFESIMREWQQRQTEVANRHEFHNRDDFTVNVQTFTKNLKFPKLSNGMTDFRYMSTDCFHLSQRGYARAANAIWNNMLEPEGTKSDNWEKEFKVFKCPKKIRPYLATRENSR